MRKGDDGGPAFPVGDLESHGLSRTNAPGHGGMSLRDWFAGQAMAEAMRRADVCKEYELTALFGKTRTGVKREEIVAAFAYQQADAMLTARKDTQP